MSAVLGNGWREALAGRRCPRLDWGLLVAFAALAGVGLVMVTSASINLADRELGQPFHYLFRQAAYLLVGLPLAALVFRVRLAWWSRAGMVALLAALALLLLVLVPGIGRTVNGATRWLALGPVNLQVSEPAKLLVLVYLAGYLVRRADEVREHLSGFLKPMAVLGLVCLLLLAEPDFGATVVLLATALTMTFMAGVRLGWFAVLLGLCVAALGLLAVASPYRMARLTAFVNPWADPFNSGFQLTQSLIAIGSGGLTGLGLGGSVQKLFYLPEAHTDFVFAVLAEELGLGGVVALIGLYAFVVFRSFAIAEAARRAGEAFASYLAYGLGTWLGLQAFINMGVNMGLLPTKGLTLPLVSYGGSSLVVMCLVAALLLRIDYETRCSVHSLPDGAPGGARRRKGRAA